MMGEIFRTFLNVISSGMGAVTEASMYSNDFATITVKTPTDKKLVISMRFEEEKTEGENANAKTV